MGLRLFMMLAVWASVPVAIAHDGHPRAVGVVHSSDICWDPDVEFPVPCDDDDD
jgi:hypothetical protein